MKEIAGYRVFNYLYFIYLFAFIVSGGYFGYLLVAEDIFSWFMAIVSAIFFLLLLLDDIYYIFTEKEIIFVHFLGKNRSLAWSEIIKITKSRGFSSAKETPHYTIIHNEQDKGKMIQVETKIPSTAKTKKYIKAFYSKGIVGEDIPYEKKVK